MEKRYEDAIAAICELLLDKSREARVKDYEIERLREKIAELEKITDNASNRN